MMLENAIEDDAAVEDGDHIIKEEGIPRDDNKMMMMMMMMTMIMKLMMLR